LPEDMSGYSNKTINRIVNEIKNLERSLESKTRNGQGTKKSVKKLKFTPQGLNLHFFFT